MAQTRSRTTSDIIFAATHAVVMGDLVSSERAPSVSRLHAVFNKAIDETNHAAAAQLISPLTITLGDEFQGICANLSAGLAVMRSLRASMLLANVECRFVLGVVSLETPVNHDRAWNMMGPGLGASRERLADKRDTSAYRFVLPHEPIIQTLMETIGAALSDIERGWTDRQREIILSSTDETATEMAARLKMSVQTYYKIRRAGRFDLYEREWSALMTSTTALDALYGLA